MRGKLKSLGAIGMAVSVGFIAACTGEKDPEPAFDCSLSDLQIVEVRTQELTGCTSLDGIIEVTSTGGEGDKSFQLNEGAPQPTGLFENLASGTYRLSVTDQNKCTSQVEIVLTAVDSDLVISDVNSTLSGCETSNGVLTINASGQGTLRYKIDNGAFQEGNEFGNLQAGEYTVTVMDDICETTSLHRIQTGVSFDDQIKTILSTNCILSGCHNGGNSLPNFSNFSEVKEKASGIRSRTQSGNMPQRSSGLTLTQEQKDLIACWVDDGALNN
ncbi:hypothetical protein FNH22_10060 [Fulvivirga sp. M361]|uniref:hypothetical protein n=1 Tax=Fulvivirga sp. M361 TaxID=2594266 RepID=UPI001179C9B6|nr:hypothetical protein [Fulvivirga sp. M361]TRX59493.1 hypothetical protein FNH22_10060 [Fulvivirga sp. M361]